MMLYVTGEDIAAGAAVFISAIDGKAYAVASGGMAGEYLGDAAENLREGFRVCLRPDGDVYEDDA